MAVPPTAPPGAPEDATFDLWIVGVILAALSNMLSSLGLLIMKISADQDKGKACHRRWRFWLGFGINLGSEVTITPIALSLAPVSLLAPMTAIGIAGSVLIAASGCLRGLKESIGPREVGAILLIIAGVVLSTAFGPRSDNEPSIDAAEAAVRSPACIVSFACVFLFTATWVAVRRLKRGPADGTLVVCLMSSVDASCLAAMSVVFLKIISVAIRIYNEGDPSPLRSAALWFAIVGLVFCAPTQLYVLNMALGNGSATLAMPVYLSCIVLLLTVCGGLIFREYEGLPSSRLALLAAGVALTVAGICLLALAQAHRSHAASRHAQHTAPRSPSRARLRTVEPVPKESLSGVEPF